MTRYSVRCDVYLSALSQPPGEAGNTPDEALANLVESLRAAGRLVSEPVLIGRTRARAVRFNGIVTIEADDLGASLDEPDQVQAFAALSSPQELREALRASTHVQLRGFAGDETLAIDDVLLADLRRIARSQADDAVLRPEEFFV